METGYGAVNWRKDEIRYDQTKSALEMFLRDLKVSGQTKFWLESCNVHALACAIDAVGGKWKYDLPVGPDGTQIYSQAVLMFIMLYSEYGQRNAPIVKDGLCENEAIANLVWVAEQCSNVKADLRTATTGQDLVKRMDAALAVGSANVLSYRSNFGTGHYVTQVYRSVTGKSFIVNDPWGANPSCNNGGLRETYPDSFFIERCAPERLRFIEIHLP